MQRFVHVVAAVACAVGTFVSVNSFAFGRVLGTVGYENLEGKNDSKPSTGLMLGALAQYDLLKLVPGFGVVVGAGLQHNSVSAKENNWESTITQPAVTVEGGLHFGMIPFLTFQGVVGYDYGFSGKVQSKVTVTTTAGQNTLSNDFDLESFDRTRATARALFSPLPLLGIGAEATYFSGNLKIKDASKSEFTGYYVGLLASFGI